MTRIARSILSTPAAASMIVVSACVLSFLTMWAIADWLAQLGTLWTYVLTTGAVLVYALSIFYGLLYLADHRGNQ